MKPLVVVSGAIANKPANGGNARMVLNWLEGLERLGVDVFFVEQLNAGADVAAGRRASREYFDAVMRAHGWNGRAALVCLAQDGLQGATIDGATAGELRDLADAADLLINISGHLAIDDLKRRVRRKAYIDLDPGYTQLWHAQGSGAARLEGHDAYFTVGQRVGSAGCAIPTGGIDWQPIRQPVVLHEVSAPRDGTGFTTIASWRGAFGPIAHEGTVYGAKAHQFRHVVDLPQLTRQRFEIALEIHPGDRADRAALEGAGWHVVDPLRVAAMPDDYCGYIEQSAAECTAAQGMYVQSQCGWFSDRTAWYLARGKPALVQDTGFAVPGRGGEGLLTFRTLAEAAAGAERIARDYRAHSAAARAIAERYFDATTELADLLERAGAA